MLVSSAEVTGTTDAVDKTKPQAPAPAAPVLITTGQVALSTAIALGTRRDSVRARFVAVVRMWAAPAAGPRPRPAAYPRRYGFLEEALMAREMHRL